MFGRFELAHRGCRHLNDRPGHVVHEVVPLGLVGTKQKQTNDAHVGPNDFVLVATKHLFQVGPRRAQKKLLALLQKRLRNVGLTRHLFGKKLVKRCLAQRSFFVVVTSRDAIEQSNKAGIFKQCFALFVVRDSPGKPLFKLACKNVFRVKT